MSWVLPHTIHIVRIAGWARALGRQNVNVARHVTAHFPQYAQLLLCIIVPGHCSELKLSIKSLFMFSSEHGFSFSHAAESSVKGEGGVGYGGNVGRVSGPVAQPGWPCVGMFTRRFGTRRGSVREARLNLSTVFTDFHVTI